MYNNSINYSYQISIYLLRGPALFKSKFSILCVFEIYSMVNVLKLTIVVDLVLTLEIVY